MNFQKKKIDVNHSSKREKVETLEIPQRTRIFKASVTMYISTANLCKSPGRWFKFTLKPPYSIACGKLLLAIWDTSFWTFLSNLDARDLETYPRTYSGHFSNICHFLMIPGPFEYF